MDHDTSYGIIPLRLQEEEWQVLLVRHHAGHWAFPKGHAENGESPHQSAERELKEETSLDICRVLSPTPLTENYSFDKGGGPVSKTVYYFIALVTGSIVNQEEEIQDSAWLSLPAASERVTFKEGKQLIAYVAEFLKTVDPQEV